MITGIRKLNWPCNLKECKNLAVVEITRQPIPRLKIICTETIKFYCAEHSPIDIKEYEDNWIEFCKLPMNNMRDY